jgi:hypothetical protein
MTAVSLAKSMNEQETPGPPGQLGADGLSTAA